MFKQDYDEDTDTLVIPAFSNFQINTSTTSELILIQMLCLIKSSNFYYILQLTFLQQEAVSYHCHLSQIYLT